jgi:hypothetical protein
VTLKYNNSTGIEVYEHLILQEAGYVPCIPLTPISTETSLPLVKRVGTQTNVLRFRDVSAIVYI